MTLRRWDPLRDLLDLQERINRLFDESLSRERSGGDRATGRWAPLTDLWETMEAFVMEVELPGVARSDIDLLVEPALITLRGRRRTCRNVQAESFHRMERCHGTFERSFRLTAEVDSERVTAELRDGVLRINLPKRSPDSAQRIPAERKT
ncbi:MAG: Hsp20/alpha crystallin family protein [Vicinamibacteria bacterium]|nr:Hsp20/alpha crystallin family protein [Vicinamibacteria bacterium]